MDLASLLSLAAEDHAKGQAQSAAAPRPHPMAQRMELRDRFARAQVKHTIQPGDIVRQKPGLGIVKEPDTTQLIFWAWYDPNDPMHVACLAVQLERAHAQPDFDCFIATLMDNGQSLLFYITSSNSLEPDPDAAEGA